MEKKLARDALAENEKQLNKSTEKGRTGDPFKDFDLDLAKVSTPDARSYIQSARDACYEFIDLLYLSDWKFYGKYQQIRVYNLEREGHNLLLRCETKFPGATLETLTEFYRRVDRRMAWEGQNLYESIEEVRAYPVDTSLYFMKL